MTTLTEKQLRTLKARGLGDPARVECERGNHNWDATQCRRCGLPKAVKP